ncbi:unnamed protein product [Calypogeia fissa]
MGNVSQRMGGKLSSVRVIQPDGIIVEYDYSIQVAMLMTLHPDYLVIHCSNAQSKAAMASRERGRQIKVMDPEDRLSLGESYILYPIPPQYKEMFTLAPVVQTEEAAESGSRFLVFDMKLRTLARFMKRLKRTTANGTRRRRRRSLWRLKIAGLSTLKWRFASCLEARTAAPAGEVAKVGGWVPLLEFEKIEQSFISPLDYATLEIQKPHMAVDTSF